MSAVGAKLTSAGGLDHTAGLRARLLRPAAGLGGVPLAGAMSHSRSVLVRLSRPSRLCFLTCHRAGSIDPSQWVLTLLLQLNFLAGYFLWKRCAWSLEIAPEPR